MIAKTFFNMLFPFIGPRFMTMVGVYLHRSYTPMKKLSIESLINLLFILSSGILIAQTSFLERRSFETQNFEQYQSIFKVKKLVL